MTEPERPTPGPAGSGSAQEATDRPLMILHIGMHKTGSTSMQVYLSAHAEQLRAAGYVYPVAGRYGDQHSVIPATFFHGHLVLPESVRRTPREEVLAAISAEVGPGESVLLSSEVFWELLAVRPDDFDAIHARLCQDWKVLLLYFARNPHAKSWSAVKHLGRLGPLPDPVGNYRGDRALTDLAEEHLRRSYPDALRVEYDSRDSVGQLLALLEDARLTSGGERTAQQAAALAQLRADHRPQTRRRRINSDLRNPYGPAVTLCVAECLAPGDPDDFRYDMLPRLYHRLFRTSDDGWSRRGLPDDHALGERVRRLAEGEQGELFSVAERQAVVAGLTSRRVRWRARAARSTASLLLATDAVRRSLPTSVSDGQARRPGGC